MSETDAVARKLAKIFRTVGNVQMGTSGGLRSDGTVSVSGVTTSAIAGDSCPAGVPCVAVKDNGQWYARSCVQTGTASEQISLQTRRQASSSVATGPVKVLFSVVRDGVRQFYVGGDRRKPKKIFQAPSAAGSIVAYISNTGKTANDWIAAIRYQTPSSAFVEHITANSQKTVEVIFPDFLFYQGHGFWTRGSMSSAWMPGAITQNGQTATVSYTQDRYPEAGSVITTRDEDGNPITWEADLSAPVVFEKIYKGDLVQSSPGLLRHTESFSGETLNSFVTKSLNVDKSFLLPNYFEPQRTIYTSDRRTGGSSSFEQYFSSTILCGINTQTALIVQIDVNNTVPQDRGSGVPEGYSAQTLSFERIEAGASVGIVDQEVKFLRANGDRFTITSGLPNDLRLNFTNLLGSRILIAPIDGRYKVADIELPVGIHAISEDGTVSSIQKNAKVFNLKSPDSTIHSASAYL